MFLPDLSIKRPVFILMQVAAVIVLGWIAYTRIPVDLMPDVQFPFMSITTIKGENNLILGSISMNNFLDRIWYALDRCW